MKQKKNILIILISIIVVAVVCVVLLLVFGKKETKYTVTFSSGTNSNITEQIVNSGELVNKPANPTKEGYIFIEWQYNGKTFDFSSKVEGNITLEAKWQKVNADIETYIIQFETDGGTTIANQVLEKGAKVEKPKDPTKTGYVFKGWYVGEKEFDFASTITENKTITAKWEKEVIFTVTFNSNNGTTVKSQKVVAGKTAVKPTNPIRTGYAFAGWKLDDKAYNFKEAVTKNITLMATWTKTYTVKFDTKGGNSIANQIIVTGQKAAKPANPTKSGYLFNSWKNGNNAYDFNTAISEDITLTATWDVAYTITFDSKGGSNVSNQVVATGTKATKPADPTKSGYTFKNWKYNGGVYDFNASVVANITLEAEWEEYVPQTFTVTFNSNGGSSVASEIVNDGGKVSQPANPTKDGHTFNGWKLGNSAFDFNTPITANTTLVAGWTQKTYVVTATPVDEYSPQVKFSVTENGAAITVSAVKYTDGVILCESGMRANKTDIVGITEVIIVLNSGIEVRATIN